MIPHNSFGIQLAVENLGEKKKREVFRGGRGRTSQRTRIRTPRRQTGSSLGRESKTRQNPLILVLVKMFGVEFALYGLLYFPLDLAVWWVKTQLVTTNSQKISVSFHQYI
jgi:hypothetical protein